MPSEFFDIFTGSPGRRAESVHSAAMSDQQQRDILNTFKDVANILKTSADQNARLARGEMQLPQQSATVDVLRNVPRAVEGAIGDYFRKQGITPELYSGEIGKASMQMARGGAPSLPKFEDEISKITSTIRQMNDEAGRASSSGGFWRQALMGGVGGAAMVGGMMSGNLIEIMSGALNAGQSIRGAFEKGGARGAAGATGQTLIGMALAAGQAAFQEAQQYVPQALEAGYTISRIRGLGGGLTQGEAGMGQLMGMGRLGGAQVLSAQQILQGTEMFAQTGGGSAAQLTEFTGRMRDFFVVYGQAGVQLLQAARNLQQWVPDGDMSKAFEDAINKSRAVGIESPQLQIERASALAQVGKQLAITDYRNIGGRITAVADTTSALANIGLGGQAGVSAVQELGQGFGGALHNASQFAFLRAAGISNQRIFEIGTGKVPITAKEIEAVSKFTMKGVGALPEFAQLAALQSIPMFQGPEAAAAIERMDIAPEVKARLLGTRHSQASVTEQAKSTVTDTRFKGVVDAYGGTLKLESEKIGKGFTEGMTTLLNTSTNIKGAGQKIVDGASTFAGAVSHFGKIVTSMSSSTGGTISTGKQSIIGKPQRK